MDPAERRHGWRVAYDAATIHWINAQSDPRIGPTHPECCPLIRQDLQWAHRQITVYRADGWGAPYLWSEGGVLDQTERDLQITSLIASGLAKHRSTKDGDA